MPLLPAKVLKGSKPTPTPLPPLLPGILVVHNSRLGHLSGADTCWTAVRTAPFGSLVTGDTYSEN